MAGQIQFDLVSPEKLLFSKGAVMVTLPGEMGVFGVLAGHAPIIASLGAGVVEIYENEEKTITDRYFVAGGFAEVNDKSCTILAEVAVSVSALDQAVVEQEVKNLTEDLAAASEDKKADIEENLLIAQAKLLAVVTK